MEQRLEMAGGGRLLLRQEGPRVRAEAVRPADGQGLYKAWLLGRDGARYLLGTLAPEGNRLVLRRSLSLGELERAGCWPPEGAEAPLAFPFQTWERWHCERSPERLVRDPLLRPHLRQPLLCRRGQEGFCLAAPFRPECPVPLVPLFCLARVERLEGRPHLVWRFDREGRPLLPTVKSQDAQ
ncbi:MAG: hypothetical protein HFF50_03360 [Lawsonibacter sp.]|nr:hypothetical protein [Lawsonibacter sp.]